MVFQRYVLGGAHGDRFRLQASIPLDLFHGENFPIKLKYSKYCCLLKKIYNHVNFPLNLFHGETFPIKIKYSKY